MELSLNEVRRERLWRKASADPVAFSKAFLKIKVPGQGIVPFDLYEAQEETLRFWDENRYTIALKARQIGFSTLAAAYVLWMVMTKPGVTILMLSRTEREAVKLLAKAIRMYKHLPSWVKERGPQRTDDNTQKMSFDNDSMIESLPSGSDPARGESADVVIVDEWAFLPNAEEAWASIEPVADVGGKVIGLSTANGAGTFYEDLYNRAKQGVGKFEAIFWPWDAAEHRDDAWYASKKADLPEWVLHQEYPRDDVECFIRSGRSVFDYDMLQSLELREPIQVHLELAEANDVSRQRWNAVNHRDGQFHIWEYPQADHGYVVGADVAEGLEHGDFSSAFVSDTRTGEVVAEWHGHVAPDLFGSDVLWPLGMFYNKALMGVEANNHGLTTLIKLKDLGYPNMYYQERYNEKTRKRTQKIGWHTTKATKGMMIDELQMALREGDLDLWSELAVGELLTYARDENGRMGGSPFDDRVMALAVCNQMRKHNWSPINPRIESDYMTGAWWERQADEYAERNSSGPQRMGRNNRRRSNSKQALVIG